MYDSYVKFLNKILKDNDISGFKSNIDYKQILEHVSPDFGKEYLKLIESNTSITKNMIKNFCNINDKIGSPDLTDFDYFTASPTSLRYIFHAHLILSHINTLKLNNLDIVEIGGGYGGLCLALHYFSSLYDVSINSYNIIDLKTACDLQKLYLNSVQYDLQNLHFNDSTTFGNNIDKKNLFLISNYCFSEIDNFYQQKYIENLFPKVSHGFITWNLIPLFDFGFNIKIEDEYPYTGGGNKYIYF